ncbi:hypothetical protein LTR28_003733 [Elasticomyces elasticus]|nr:hypothetical protein LTR28_003733 [Elasticomyces elasticus]
MIVGQILIIFFGGVAFSIHHQNGAQWGYAIVLGALSIPIGVCIRLIPDELAAKCVPDFLKRRSKPEVVVSDEEAGPGTFAFNQALMDIRDELAFIRRIRGGRLSSLEFKIKHPIEAWDHSRAVSRSRSSSLGQTPIVAASEGEAQKDQSHLPAPATPESRHRRTASRRGRSRSNSALAGAALAGIVAGSIAGWSPIDRGHGEVDSLKFARDRSKSDLSRTEGVETHPDTSAGDPVLVDERRVGADEAPSQATETTPAFGMGPFGAPPDGRKPEARDGAGALSRSATASASASVSASSASDSIVPDMIAVGTDVRRETAVAVGFFYFDVYCSSCDSPEA